MTDVLVIGSVNLDLSASVSRMPLAGETVTNATLERYPGGKGANQALAARRLGANVKLIACVGDDADAREALALLNDADVDLSQCLVDAEAATGIALICVAPSGENNIVVAPGANTQLTSDRFQIPTAQALICQLEIPSETVTRSVQDFSGFVCVNLAPARTVDDSVLTTADLIVVNETEAAWYGDKLSNCRGLIATTYGKDGAVLRDSSGDIARASPPTVNAIDATGAGDTFTAALTLALVEGQDAENALQFACAAAAMATTCRGAQPSLPMREDVDLYLSKKV